MQDNLSTNNSYIFEDDDQAFETTSFDGSIVASEDSYRTGHRKMIAFNKLAEIGDIDRFEAKRLAKLSPEEKGFEIKKLQFKIK